MVVSVDRYLRSVYGEVIEGTAIYDWDVDLYEYAWICPVCGVQFMKFSDLVNHIVSCESEGHIRLRVKLKRLSRVLGIHELDVIRVFKWIRL